MAAAMLVGSGQAAQAGNGNGGKGGKPTTTTTTAVGTKPAELQVAPPVSAALVYPCVGQGLCGYYLVALTARLRDATTKSALAGRTVDLAQEGAFVRCQAVTNEHGLATCRASVTWPFLVAGPAAATFSGDVTYAAATGNSRDNPIVP